MAVSPLTVSGTDISRHPFPEPGQMVTKYDQIGITVMIQQFDSPAAIDVSLETTGGLKMENVK